jgi:hypothetical protein
MERRNGRTLYVVPMGFEARCTICQKALYSGTTFYRINGHDVCRLCEGKTERKPHRLRKRRTTEWMKYEV